MGSGELLVILVLVALGLAIYNIRDRRKGGDVSREQLYICAARAFDYYCASATPTEVLDNPDFQEGVELLETGAYETSDLIAYVGGDNEIVACMALEALRRSDTLGEVRVRILASLSRTHDRVRQLFFHFLAEAVPIEVPLIAEVIAFGDPDWQADVDALALRELIGRRQAAGERLQLTPVITGASNERLQLVQTRLHSLRNRTLAPMQAELQQRQSHLIDRDYLGRVGRVWSDDGKKDSVVMHPPLDDGARDIEALLTDQRPRSVLLVGDGGVGKTSLARVVAARLQEIGWTIFEAGPQELMAGQVYIGQLEQRIQELVARIRGRPILWLVADFQGLAFAGRHQYSATSILDTLLPLVESGDITLLAEIQPGAYERLLTTQPRCREAMAVRQVRPLSSEGTLELARAWAKHHAPADERPLIDEATLAEAWQLAQQYLSDRATPGSLMQLLERTRERASAGGLAIKSPLATADLIATLAQSTGLPASILDSRAGLDLQALRDLFHRRVVGQPEAVQCLVERVAMIKAGVTDATRPSGVFLFAGPTGTGKTEIAKTLAEFLFGSPDRMIRLDMSEYQTPAALEALLGGEKEDREGSLVSRIRTQPFSIVLLDEFEKAHPNIWDIFLQVFDDGRLTDRGGVTADFRHAIIILTSNLGGAIPAGLSLGFSRDGGGFQASDVSRAIAGSFRKEFLNRIDRVVVFQPLSRATMREILRKELDEVFERRGLRNRSWAVEYEASALDFLLEQGFTPDLGARPLKRAIERHLLAPLAMTIVNHQLPAGDQFLFVRSDGTRLDVEFVDPDAPEPEIVDDAELDADDVAGRGGTTTLEAIALHGSGNDDELECLRSHYRGLRSSVDSEAWREAKDSALARLATPEFWESPERFGVLGHTEYLDRIESGLQSAGSLLERLARGGGRGGVPKHLISRLAEQLHLLEAARRGVESQAPRDAFVLVELGAKATSDDEATVAFAGRIVAMYRAWANQRRMRVTVLEDSRNGSGEAWRVTLSVSGYGAYVLLEEEDGLHVFEEPSANKRFGKRPVRVRVAPQPDDAPARSRDDLVSQARAAFADQPRTAIKVARVYREKPSPLVRDHKRGWRSGRLQAVLDGAFDLIGGAAEEKPRADAKKATTKSREHRPKH